MKLKWIIVAVVAVVISYVIAYGLPSHESSEEFYQRTTSAEVKAVHREMARQLKTVTPGDFIILERSAVLGVRIHVVYVDNLSSGVGVINYKTLRQGGFGEDSPESLGRFVTRLVRKTDPNWPEVAKQFFAQ